MWSLMCTPRMMTQLLSRTPLPMTHPAEMDTSGLRTRGGNWGNRWALGNATATKSYKESRVNAYAAEHYT